ncbi:alpha/beta hydrolase [Brachybacterium sp. YJGR34]|uniref:alpha/beta hydrolase n=1 Tax=Brachybacterium sp. YJGR34 TaxID=2059911 RepID=UPI000E0AF217|nr:alpha/beta hydrolase [Brachybacterium sp. YJGR34]
MTLARRIRRGTLRVLAVLCVLVVLAVLALVLWARTGVMPAEPAPLDAVLEDPGITVEESSTAMVMRPADDAEAGDVGLVFYPGAKVEAEAYAERLSDLVTEEGMSVVIVKPWLHLALFDPRGTDTFTARVPSVTTWMVGGHSMGGVRACLAAEDVDALVLLASYCSTDLSASGLPVLSLAGSEDGLSTPEKVDGARDLLPADAEMVEIEGASHASFGDYGPQPGDGTPTITDPAMDAVVTAEVGDLAQAVGPNGD